jgi:hypothetical protein
MSRDIERRSVAANEQGKDMVGTVCIGRQVSNALNKVADSSLRI